MIFSQFIIIFHEVNFLLPNYSGLFNLQIKLHERLLIRMFLAVANCNHNAIKITFRLFGVGIIYAGAVALGKIKTKNMHYLLHHNLTTYWQDKMTLSVIINIRGVE